MSMELSNGKNNFILKI